MDQAVHPISTRARLSLGVLAAFAGSGVLLGLLVVLYWDQILEFLRLQDAILLF